MCRVIRPGRKLVDIDVYQPERLDVCQARLLCNLATGSGFDRCIIRFDVPSGLQPLADLLMMNEQNAGAVGRRDEAAGSEVPGIEMATRRRIAVRGAEIKHATAIGRLLQIGRIEALE